MSCTLKISSFYFCLQFLLCSQSSRIESETLNIFYFTSKDSTSLLVELCDICLVFTCVFTPFCSGELLPHSLGFQGSVPSTILLLIWQDKITNTVRFLQDCDIRNNFRCIKVPFITSFCVMHRGFCSETCEKHHKYCQRKQVTWAVMLKPCAVVDFDVSVSFCMIHIDLSTMQNNCWA